MFWWNVHLNVRYRRTLSKKHIEIENSLLHLRPCCQQKT